MMRSKAFVRRILAVAAFVLVEAAGTGPVLGSGEEAPAGIPGNGRTAMAETKEDLTEHEGDQLISIARETIEARLKGSGKPPEEGLELSPKFSRQRGTFVTLTMGGSLRGCIGHIIARESILDGVKENALNAAFRDPRFRPVTEKEWEKVKVEVSILTDPQPLPYAGAEDLLSKLRPHVDGVILKKGYNQATFLPQVWEQLPRASEFLTHLCLKAGLAGDAWEKEPLEISIYQVQAFEEE